MTALVLVGLMIFGYAIGAGMAAPANRIISIVRLAPIALFAVWTGASPFGLVSAALLSNVFYVLGLNLGRVEANPLLDKEPPIGAWVYEKYGSLGSFILFMGSLLVGALTYWIA